jgi:toxin ParE1/3/4
VPAFQRLQKNLRVAILRVRVRAVVKSAILSTTVLSHKWSTAMGSPTLEKVRSDALNLSESERAELAPLDLLEQDIVPLTSTPGVAGARGVKRQLPRRFPYAVVVRERDAEIFVIAIAHHGRRPGYWRDRLRT